MFRAVERSAHAERLSGIFDQYQRKSMSQLGYVLHAHLRHAQLIRHTHNGNLRRAIGPADEFLYDVRIGELHGFKQISARYRRIVDTKSLTRMLAAAHHLQRIDIDQKCGHRQLLYEASPQLLSALRLGTRQAYKGVEALKYRAEVLRRHRAREEHNRKHF